MFRFMNTNQLDNIVWLLTTVSFSRVALNSFHCLRRGGLEDEQQIRSGALMPPWEQGVIGLRP